MLGFHGISEFSISEIATPTSTSDVLVLLGGGPGREREDYIYNPDVFRHKQEELKRKTLEEKRLELKRIEKELAESEGAKQEKLAMAKEKFRAKNAAKKLAALEASLQEEINRLRIERVWLMRLIDDEEAILVLLLTWPLH